jgi:hypothetical protein
MVNVLPVLYDQKNLYNAQINPSTVHASNTALSAFFQRYLMLKLFSRYDFTLPEDWDYDYFRYVLFTIGFIGVMQTDKYGVICQHGTASGYNVYYRPSRLLVSNPALRRTYDLRIGEDCEIIKLSPDWRGAYDLIQLYADQMAVCMESFGVNAINSKFSFVFAADNKNMAETMKKMFDQISGGNPAAFVWDKQLFDDEGNPRWQLFVNNLKQNYVGNDLLQSLTTIEHKFNTLIGFNNANTDKKERLNSDEVNANNEEVRSLSSLWLEEMTDSMKKVNDMFGLNLSVKLREVSNDITFSDGPVPVR